MKNKRTRFYCAERGGPRDDLSMKPAAAPRQTTVTGLRQAAVKSAADLRKSPEMCPDGIW